MSVSRSYAKALLDVATESGLKAADLDRIESELGEFADAMGASRELYIALTSPIVSGEDKAEVAKAVAGKMGLSKLTAQFMTLVARKGRGPAIDEIRNKRSSSP